MNIKKAVLEMKKGNVVEVSLGQTQFKLSRSNSNIVHYTYPGHPWKYFGTLAHFSKVETSREFIVKKDELAKELLKPEKKSYRYSKKVLLPIRVPVGKYCWGKKAYEENTRICSHFTNEHGIPECTLLTYFLSESLKYDNNGRVPKPKICLELEECKLVRREK